MWFRKKTQTISTEQLMQEAQQAEATVLSTPAPAIDASSAQPMLPDGQSEGLPEPTAAPGPSGLTPDFRLTVQDVFSIRGRGTVVTGAVESGTISVGAVVSVTRNGSVVRRVKVTGVEMFRKRLDSATAGQNVGLLLADGDRNDYAHGDVLTP